MLEVVIVILLILWLVGWYTATAGTFIHLLFIVALLVLVVRLVTDKKVV